MNCPSYFKRELNSKSWKIKKKPKNDHKGLKRKKKNTSLGYDGIRTHACRKKTLKSCVLSVAPLGHLSFKWFKLTFINLAEL